MLGLGYRGERRDGWTSDGGETLPGLTGSTGAAGGGYGGIGGSGSEGGGVSNVSYGHS